MVHIKVAVRIRPMSDREMCQKESVIVSNSEKCILVTNPKMPERSEGADSRQRIRRFAVDFCYDPKYPELSTQEAIFEEVGTEILAHMFDGYNACVLAYGHSASGKTHTMMGTRDDPGLTPRICQELCRRMNNKSNLSYHVSVSFLEIYNEKVRDLLVDEDPNLPAAFSLRVREHPKLGPYVQGLSEHVVEREADILSLLNLGNSRRSTAATESNSHSSRSHAVFTIRFKQVGSSTAKSSKVHLVDLAGSLQEEQIVRDKKRERASAVQSRARLKEGANINKSLVTLGNVISALAENSDTSWGKSCHPFVPYRDSVLTWLLKDTLGGNSNTIMIATISPARSCYSDTINTLRYAKRTKKIVNQPTVNEDPKIRTIRELRDEVSRLKTMLLSYTAHQESSATDNMTVSAEACSSSKWQQGPATLCAVGLQTEDMDLGYPHSRWITPSMDRPFANDLLGHLTSSPNSTGEDEGSHRNIATLDILSIACPSKQQSCVPVPHVNEINAENTAGVNRVIADPTRLSELSRLKANSCAEVPRVYRSLFKRRRGFLRRGHSYWTMLHRSRPDLIKSIGARNAETASTSGQPADVLSQSTSENSLHSSGSTESRTRAQLAPSLSRTSSVGDASGSSTPTQPQRPATRKKEGKRAEIVASVTSRLYAIKKKPDPRLEALQAEKEEEEEEDLEELKLCKRARMKLFDLSRKLAMAKKVKRVVDSDTQTEAQTSTLRVKEKGVATDQQGVLMTQTSATNTSEGSFSDPEPPVVMNQLFLPNSGSFVIECGPNLRMQIPPQTNDSGSQTIPQTRNQTTSPEKLQPLFTQFDGFLSDDSLDLELKEVDRGKLATKFYSCQELNARIVPLYGEHRSSSLMNLSDKKIEKSLEPISRYAISGTNAIYEYDPNKSVADKVVYTNCSEKAYESGTKPDIIYQQYQPQLFNGLPMVSNETLASSTSLAEDNLSSGTSSASTGSSGAVSDSSSDDFVFIENAAPPMLQTRELYTISENSEPSCSPVSSQSPRIETKPVKKVNWAEMECSGSNQFLNFNYKPSALGKNDQSAEALFPSEDSITFVFLGAKHQGTSVLMEVVKRSLLGGSDASDLSSDKSNKLMRSVSVDTAMIALSRLARNQRSNRDVSRSTSLVNVSSAGVQVDIESSESGVQCNIVEKVNASCEIRPKDSSSQCDLSTNVRYSLGTNTTTDQETATDAERTESTTQTDLEHLFEPETISLPRRVASTSTSESWNDMKKMVLGQGTDLFPNYLNSDDDTATNPSRKTVSWSDLNNQQDPPSTRRVRFAETLPRRGKPSTETVREFLKEATHLLQNIQPPSESSESDENDATSSSLLLRRRKKSLSRIKILKTESSVQTDTEKISRFVQTGGLASSLVGPPIRRSLTPNLTRENNEDFNLNLTWPRRRLAAKPPTGLKTDMSPRNGTPRRSGSISSRGTFEERRRYSPEMIETRKKLELAIERDKVREQNLTQFLESNFQDDSSGHENFSETPKINVETRFFQEKTNSSRYYCSQSSSRSPSPREARKLCRCTCHSDLSGNRHCHTCCVPCSTQSPRPYSSEPSLSLSSCNSSRSRGSPSAHLRHLIALRRTIVAAQKSGN